MVQWTPLAAPAAELVPNGMLHTPIGAAMRGTDDWATQGLHISYPGVCPTEVTPASLFSVSTQHGRLVDTGYKSNLHRHRGGCCRQPLTVGDAIIVHWSATARLKPGQLHVGADLPESACLFALPSHTRCCSTTTD